MTPDLFSWLDSAAIVAGNSRLSVAECFGFATGIWCVALTARGSIWNFPVGIANSALLLLLFLHARLFADSSLQLMFIALSIRGWWQWARHDEAQQLPVTTASSGMLLASVAASIVLTAILIVVLRYAKGSIPLFDALITALSVVAQWLLNRKVVQNWYWWIAVDIVSIPVYAYKELYLIALLYCVFLGICVAGLASWRRSLTNVPAAGEECPA